MIPRLSLPTATTATTRLFPLKLPAALIYPFIETKHNGAQSCLEQKAGQSTCCLLSVRAASSGFNHTLKRPRTPIHPLCKRHFSSLDEQVKYIPPSNDTWQTNQEDDSKNATSVPMETSTVASQRREDGGPTDFFISHITRGGTPCDPAPAPFQLADFGEESLYTLVLLRHGESEWNKLNQYTGWVDVNLTAEGKKEARAAGRLLYENGIEIDHAFSSVLRRASFSCNMALNTAQQHWVPVTKTWRLNERHYGALQGYNKDTAFRELGIDQELVMQMRRSYDVRPPTMQDDHPYWHGNDRRCVLGALLCYKQRRACHLNFGVV